MQNTIIFEDNHLLAIHKLTGQLVQGDKTGDRTLPDDLKDYIKHKYNKPGDVFLGVIHRLDRPVTGLVIFAKTSKCLERMNKQFATRETDKTYLAVIHGRPEELEGTLVHHLVKNEEKNIVRAHKTASKHSKEAILSYKTLAMVNKYSLVMVFPETGRSHQIRVQLSSMKCPIAGDVKYGSSTSNFDKSICLHSYSLQFSHPTLKEKMVLKTKPELQGLWKLFTDYINTEL